MTPHHRATEVIDEKPGQPVADAQPLEEPAPEQSALEKGRTPPAPRPLTEEKEAKWEKEIDRLYRAYEFHLDFGLKIVGFYYAILGGIISVYFSGNGRNAPVLLVLLGLPIVLGFVLGVFFFYGAWLWCSEAKYMHSIAEKLRLPRIRKVELLTHLLIGFGVLFVLVAGFLIWLMVTLL